MRASIWDMRDLQKGQLSPRQKQANIGAPIGSPRHARVPAAPRLSAIGRLALRERACAGPVLHSHHTQILYGGLPPRVGSETGSRPWPTGSGRFAEQAVSSEPPPVAIPRVNPRKVLDRLNSPPTSARSKARSSSVPRAYQPPRRPPPLSGVSTPGMPPMAPKGPTDPDSIGSQARSGATSGCSIAGREDLPPAPVISPATAMQGSATALETDLGRSRGASHPSPLGAARSYSFRAPSPDFSDEVRSHHGSAGSVCGAQIPPRAFSENDLVLSLHTYHSSERRPSGPGLGAIQPNGRAQVLQQWCSRTESQPSAHQSSARPPLAPTRQGFHSQPQRSSSAVSSSAVASPDTFEMEWSTLGDASKQALRQWVAGQLGGRHCMLVLEHGASAQSAVAPLDDNLTAFNPRSAGSLNVLSGLQAEFELVNGQGGWLFEAVFARAPTEVLQQALEGAAEDLGELYQKDVAQIPVEQANLALRRRALKAQAPVGQRATPSGSAALKRDADEYMQTQIWLELLRLHYEGSQQMAATAVQKAGKDRVQTAWDDRVVLRELGKPEPDIEAESQQMSLETLRAQNRGIEDYVMRLVRQRDELRHATKLVEEQDSYFILGLPGPDATDDEVKKAYRQLARREHPDKAGIGNKKRFQAIQHAYTSVLRQRKEGSACGLLASPRSKDKPQDMANKPEGSCLKEAARLTVLAREAADHVGKAAHRIIKAHEESAEAQSLPKKRGLMVLREITRQSALDLQGAAKALRQLGEATSGVGQCAEDAMVEHRDWASTTVAGVGLRDRAIIVDDAGRAAESSADLLDQIVEATEATLKKVEKASPENAGPGQARDEVLNLMRLGVRLLGESIARTAAVARRSAEEALSAASKAVELGHGLVALEREVQKERERHAAKQRGDDDSEPMAAGDAPAPDGESGGGSPQRAPGAADAADKDDAGDRESAAERMHDFPEEGGPNSSPRDALKTATKRVKERHVALRVKNLRFLSTLNDEALRLQTRLRTLMLRSEGALLPEVSVPQKKWIFDLVTQLLDNALSEAARQADKNQSTAPLRILERSFGFALALEHAQALAMPADSRTQALRLAALVDMELLRDIIDGPFKKRLAGIGLKRAGNGASGSSVPTARRGLPPSRDFGAVARAWDESAQQLCSRLAKGLTVLSTACRTTDDERHSAPEAEAAN